MALRAGWQSNITSAAEGIRCMFNKQLMSDVQFTFVNGTEMKVIYAHSMVLCMRSYSFCQKLQKSIGRSHIIPVTDCSYDIFLMFMRYVYESEFVLTADTVVELTKLAIKYDMNFLMDDCLRFITNSVLTHENVHDFLELSIDAKNEPLIEKIFEFIFNSGQGKEILTADQFKNLSKTTLKEILIQDRQFVNVSEIDIFNSVIRWSEHKCTLNNKEVNSENIRETLGGLIKMIRFTGMSIEEYKKCSENYKGLLTKEEDAAIILSILNNDRNGYGFFEPRQ